MAKEGELEEEEISKPPISHDPTHRTYRTNIQAPPRRLSFLSSASFSSSKISDTAWVGKRDLIESILCQTHVFNLRWIDEEMGEIPITT